MSHPRRLVSRGSVGDGRGEVVVDQERAFPTPDTEAKTRPDWLINGTTLRAKLCLQLSINI
jgi:hypothetical protein